MNDQNVGAGPSPSRVIVVGSGFAGIAMAIRLKQQGIDDFVVLERAEDLGGTWRDNTYPGCACDVPSHLYSFSFAPNPRWSRTFSGQPEIFAYLRRCAEQFGIVPHIRYGHEVLEAAWDDDRRHWRVETPRGVFTAPVLVSAMGALSEPSVPRVAGLDDFAGPVFHSATWDHQQDLAGRRVAVIGTGASAIQFVPRIAPEVERLHLFQRTPPWILPRPDRDVSAVERFVYARLPVLQRAMRAGVYVAHELTLPAFAGNQRMRAVAEQRALRHLRRQVADPELRDKLTPDYRIGCKRILLSDDYYPALTRPNVEVVTDPIARVASGAVVTADGTRRQVDAVVLATGFRVTDVAAANRLRGRGGVLLADVWQGSPQAYLGTTVAGFPNLFMLVGPNTGLGHNSMVYMIESQVAYVMSCLEQMSDRDIATIDVRPDVQTAYNVELQSSMRDTVWTAGGCRSWYLDRFGRNTTLWPTFTWRYRRRTRAVHLSDYRTEPRERERRMTRV